MQRNGIVHRGRSPERTVASACEASYSEAEYGQGSLMSPIVGSNGTSVIRPTIDPLLLT